MRLSKNTSLLLAAFAILSFTTLSFAGPTGSVRSNDIRDADGTSGQSTTTGSGVKTGHIQNGAVTDAKITGPISATKISTTGLNADTVDGKHAADLALVGHNHDGVYQKKYGKMAVVAQIGGDYSDPVTAMNDVATWCGTPSASNPCLLKIMPGVYNVDTSPINMQSYVSIKGSGQDITKIIGSFNNNDSFNWIGLINTASNTTLSDITIENTNRYYYIVGISIMDGNNSVTIENVNISVSNFPRTSTVGIDLDGTPDNILIRNVNININSNGSVRGIVARGDAIAVDNIKIGATSIDNPGDAIGLFVIGAKMVVRNSTIASTGTGSFAIFDQVNGGAVVEIINSELSSPTNALSTNAMPHISNYFINNTKIAGVVSSADVGTVRCLNGFDANYMPYVCQ